MKKQPKDKITNVRLTTADQLQLEAISIKTRAAKLAIVSLLVSKSLRDAPELNTPEFWEWWSELGSPF